MKQDADTLYDELGVSSSPRLVLTADNTERAADERSLGEDRAYSEDVDRLFGARPDYFLIKKERPQHRMILWLSLNASKTREIATALRITEATVLRVQKQPWFQDAFLKLSKEMGKDMVRTFLEGHVQNALIRVVDLSLNADSDAVKLAANKELLDRYCGKPVVRTEVKEERTVDMTVTNVTALLAERDVLTKQLIANGVLTAQPN